MRNCQRRREREKSKILNPYNGRPAGYMEGTIIIVDCLVQASEIEVVEPEIERSQFQTVHDDH